MYIAVCLTPPHFNGIGCAASHSNFGMNATFFSRIGSFHGPYALSHRSRYRYRDQAAYGKLTPFFKKLARAPLRTTDRSALYPR